MPSQAAPAGLPELAARLETWFRARRNPRGLILARAAVLEVELGCSFDALACALAALEEAGRVELLAPLPYLVLALRPQTLPGLGRGSAAHSAALAPRAYSYSFPKQSSDERKAIEDGGAGEGDALLGEILATLGERDPGPFRGVLDHFSAATVRAALERVRRTPPERVRKSRTAYFRYLLGKSH